jgi:hypothetical protein
MGSFRSSVRFCPTRCFPPLVILSNRLLSPLSKILSPMTFFSNYWTQALVCYHSDKRTTDSTFLFFRILRVLDSLRESGFHQCYPENLISYSDVHFELHLDEVFTHDTLVVYFEYLLTNLRRSRPDTFHRTFHLVTKTILTTIFSRKSYFTVKHQIYSRSGFYTWPFYTD